MQDEIRDLILRRGGFIDEHDVPALKFVYVARRRVYRQRRPRDDQKIRPAQRIKRCPTGDCCSNGPAKGKVIPRF